ncbi:replication initiation protein [Telluribacter sp.]|jgi:plasmid replication initiation protein|uniref:replication initiation protein n=1 Tax=Telluribacter sp. TaxID=1978767 RepID=UPI002E158F70|nr:replication initiation protein [Telluribacter sp.]
MARKKNNYQDRYLIRMQGGKRGLVEATSKMDIHEFRVFMTMLTMVLPEDHDFVEYEIRTQDILKLFSLSDDGRYYEAIRDAAERLFNKKFVIFERKEDGEIYKTTIHLIDETSEPVKESEQNRIRVKFNAKLKPYLLQLQREYLTIDVRNITQIQSPYSLKLYIILKHQYNLGNRKAAYTIERLREILAIDDHEYPLYGNFKQKIIKKGMADLEKNTDLMVTYLEEKKAGRAVESVVFHLEARQTTRLTQTKSAHSSGKALSGSTEGIPAKKKDFGEEQFDEYQIADVEDANKEDPLDKLYQDISRYVSRTTLEKWIGQYPYEQIERGIRYALQQGLKGKVKNMGAYLQKMVATADLIDSEQVQKEAKRVLTGKKQQVASTDQVQKQIEELREQAHGQCIELFRELVESQEDAQTLILSKLKMGLFSSYYKNKLSFNENLEDPALSGILVGIARQLYPGIFTSVIPLEEKIYSLEKGRK